MVSYPIRPRSSDGAVAADTTKLPEQWSISATVQGAKCVALVLCYRQYLIR